MFCNGTSIWTYQNSFYIYIFSDGSHFKEELMCKIFGHFVIRKDTQNGDQYRKNVI